jgi:membrane protein DedA with SNARE-associated domain
MQSWLIGFATNHDLLIYALLVVLACAEGPWLSLICGIVLRLGFLDFWLVYGTLMLGDLLGDMIWYWIGRRWGLNFVRRWGKYFSITETGVAKVEEVFNKYKHSILFVSKISNGFGFALVTLITAGLVRIPFGRYMSVNLAGQFIWSGMLIAVGYYFSQLYLQFDNILGRVSIVAGFVVLVAMFLGYRKYMRSKIEKLDL